MVAQELLDYIKQQLQDGVSRDAIKSSLISRGWSEDEVRKALSVIEDQQTTPINAMSTPAGGSNKKIFYVIFVILLLIAAITGGYFYLKNKTSLLSGEIRLDDRTLSQWKQIPDIGDQECWEIATKGEKIFISCENHLYKSLDGGKTWEIDSFWDNLNSRPSRARIKLNDFPYHIVFDNSGNTVFAASGISGIYRSQDGGQGWEAINKGVRTSLSGREGVGVSALVISPSDNNILYAVAGDYTLIKTENKGDSWQIMQNFVSVDGLSVNSRNPNEIYLSFAPTVKSSDGGKTIVTGQDSLPRRSSIISYYVDPIDFQRIIVGGLGGIFTSTNGGNSWESLGNTLKGKDLPEDISRSSSMNRINTITGLGQKWIVSLAVNPSDPNIITIGTEAEGVMASQDNGKTWVEVNKGLVLRKQNQREFIIVKKVHWSDDGSKLYLLSNHGVYILRG